MQTQSCRIVLENTDWNMFKDSSIQDSSMNIEEYTSTVTGFLRKCVDVVPTITIRTNPNQKPWMNRYVCTMLRARTAAFHVSRTNLDNAQHIQGKQVRHLQTISDAKR
jgi:hypothetical protein